MNLIYMCDDSEHFSLTEGNYSKENYQNMSDLKISAERYETIIKPLLLGLGGVSTVRSNDCETPDFWENSIRFGIKLVDIGEINDFLLKKTNSLEIEIQDMKSLNLERELIYPPKCGNERLFDRKVKLTEYTVQSGTIKLSRNDFGGFFKTVSIDAAIDSTLSKLSYEIKPHYLKILIN